MKYIKTNIKLIILISIITIISLISLYNADIINTSVNNITFKQTIWLILGIILILFIYIIKNNIIINNIHILYIIFNILLFLLLIFGKNINNAKCWFKIPGIGTIQPSEFMKVILIIYISKIIISFRKKYNRSFYNDFLLYLRIFIMLLIPSILTFLEPDTGAIFMYIIPIIFILFIDGFNKKWLFIILSSITLIISIFIVLYFFNNQLFFKILGDSFYLRVERITNWASLNGLQLNNSIISIGSGGMLGGIDNDIYFPEAHTDFIFSVYSSNFGFIGSLFLITIISLFDIELINISIKSKNINKYIIIGFVGLIIYQQIQNISMTIGLLPITGITLPLISYGGSSLLNYMIIIGIIFNINYYNNKYKN